jgi:hypothetical protein
MDISARAILAVIYADRTAHKLVSEAALLGSLRPMAARKA